MIHEVVIRVEDLWKRYGGIGAEVKRLLSFRRDDHNSLADGTSWVLRNLNLEVRRGETLGIMGRNGAGKSTLLKLLAGVTPATRGHIEIHGRIFPMIELNAGVHPYLTGRQNVRLLGAVMGFSHKEIRKRMPEIEQFCELGHYFDRPVWTYSSGMLARLGFGVAVNVDADILLIDEVLAVGDLGFQKKCFDKIETIRKNGATIILVSHNVRQIQRICDQAILLERGQTTRGGPEIIIQTYMEQLLRERYSDVRSGSLQGIWEGSGEMTVLSVKIFDHQGCENNEFVTFESLKVQIEYKAHQPLSDLILGFNIFTTDMILVHSLVSEAAIPDLSLPAGTGTVACVIPELRLFPGPYLLSIRIKDKNNRTVLHGERIGSFLVRPSPETQINVGLVYTSAYWEVNDQKMA